MGRFLAGVELFSALDPAQLAAIAAAATVREFSAGDLVVDAFTAPPTEIYVVLTGEVDLWHDQDRVTQAGREVRGLARPHVRMASDRLRPAGAFSLELRRGCLS